MGKIRMGTKVFGYVCEPRCPKCGEGDLALLVLGKNVLLCGSCGATERFSDGFDMAKKIMVPVATTA